MAGFKIVFASGAQAGMRAGGVFKGSRFTTRKGALKRIATVRKRIFVGKKRPLKVVPIGRR